MYANPGQTRQIVFIDSEVEDYQYLAKLVKPGIETIAIEPQRDGVAQISQVLAQRHNIDAVHLVSHGQPGRLQLGRGELNLDNLPEYQQFLKQWQNSFSDDAAILIYGCQVAAADVGVEFVEAISQLTGINVVASNTLTGGAEKGGDWELQVATREPVKTALAFQEEGLKKYDRVLANPIPVNPGDVNGLIDAINDANNSAEDDTIQLAAGSTYTLNSVDNTVLTNHKTSYGTFLLPSNNGLPSIADESIAGKLTIQGNGATIQRNSSAIDDFRIFHVESGADLTLDNLTVANGSLQNSSLSVLGLSIPVGGLGGGIYNAGNLELTNSTITNNTVIGLGGGISNTGYLTVSGSTLSHNEAKNVAGTGDGGGINNHGGTVQVIDSIFYDNLAEESGGGVWNNYGGSLTVNNSIFDSNTAHSRGGGIHNSRQGIIDIDRSTFVKNIADHGGGINNYYSTANITNSTVSHNRATFKAGGINHSLGVQRLTITNSTITGNIGGTQNIGGLASDSIADIKNTIIAGNFNNLNEFNNNLASTNAHSDVSGDFIGDRNNLIGNIAGSSGFNTSGTDLSFASLGITSIADVLETTLELNGAPAGSPMTYALVDGSPAIDAGNNSFATMSNDQRGDGFNRISGTSVDIGAYELDVENPTASLTVQDITTSGGNSHTFTVEYKDDRSLDVSSIDDSDIIVTSPTGATLNATLDTVSSNSSGTPISATYKIDAPDGTWDKADNGTYTVDLQANQVTDTTGNPANAGNLGNFKVIIPPDSQNPTASLSVKNITTSGGNSHTFTVEYQDNQSLDVSSIDDSDIIVTSPTGATLNATLDTVTPNGNGTPISAIYKINALGGTWDKADNGTYTVKLKADEVTDTTGNTANAGTLGNFKVTIPNIKPSFTSHAVTAAKESSVYTYNIVTTDTDGVIRTIAEVNSLPTWLTLTDNGNGTATLTGTPSKNHVGNLQVDLKVTDDDGDFSTQSWQLAVAGIDETPPEFTSNAVVSATEDSAYTYNIDTSEPNNKTRTITAVTSLPSWLNLTDNGDGTATLTGTPTNNHVGNHQVELKVTDSDGEFATQIWQITVANVNDPPSFTSNAVVSATEDSNYTYNITTTDIDSQNLTITAVSSLPTWLTLTDNGDGTATLTGTPSNDDVGNHPVALKVTDNEGESTIQTWQIAIAGIDETPPTFTSNAVASATEDSAYTYNIDTSEPTDISRIITAVNPLPTWLTLTDNGNGTATLTGTPSNDDVGNHPVALKVTDNEGESTIQTWQLVVDDIDAPITQDSTKSNANDILENPEVTQIQENLGLGDVNIEELASQLPENLDVGDLNVGDIGDVLESDNLDIEEILPLVSQVADSGILPEDINLEQFIPVNPPLTPPSEGGGQITPLKEEGEQVDVFPVQPAANDRINILPTVLPGDDNQDIDRDIVNELAICDHFTELNFGEILLNRTANYPEKFPNDANTFMGTPDPDVFNGWDGNDTIFGYASGDMILGGLGSAVPVGNQVERDLLLGNQGNDTLGGNEGADRIYGGQDDDLMFGGKDDDHLWGDRGNDTVMGDMGSDRIYGGPADPSLAAEDGSDLLLGGSGDDFLNGNQKADRLCGGDGHDTVRGGKGDDIVCGHTGNDWLLGDRGNDTLCGGDGDDILYGGTEFNDAGEGEDILFGGKGRDRFVLSKNSGGDRILDFEIGVDLLLLTGGLTFADLSITELDNNTTAISTDNQLIAILNNVNYEAIGAAAETGFLWTTFATNQQL